MRDRRIAPLVLVVGVLVMTSITANGRPSAGSWPPYGLRDTGLYADWSSKTVDPRHMPYSPQYPLWTDGAAKRRWIHLPAGTSIDASDPDVWHFPVGTRFWKEFSFSRRAETRFIEHTPEGWRYATYVWNDDESDAGLAPERGVPRSVEIREGVRHTVPSRVDCRACHEGSPVRALGFSALQLSPDRDPNAPHAEAPPAGAVDLPTLRARGLVSGLSDSLVTHPPRINAPTATARAALGYLHANCSSCHTRDGELSTLGFSLHYPLGASRGAEPPALLTALGRTSRFQMPGWIEPGLRLRAGEPERSVLLARMGSRHPVAQMPPLGTSLVDVEALHLLGRWIAEDLGSHQSTVTTAQEDE